MIEQVYSRSVFKNEGKIRVKREQLLQIYMRLGPAVKGRQ